MSLTRQIIMIFIGTILLFFIGTFVITIHQVKGYFEEQLSNNAQDSATALALSISKQYENDTGRAMILAQVKAAFDRGYYSLIEVSDLHGNVIVKRYVKPKPNAVPDWFIQLVSFENRKKSALITHGWKQIGKIEVKSNAALAYHSLWQTTLTLFFLFASLTGILSILGVLFISRLLKPLKGIIQQAIDIGRKNLYVLNVKARTKELNELSLTINDMVQNLQKLFDEQLKETESLRQKAYVDSLTGLGNRQYFFQQLENFLHSEEIYDSGYLVQIKLDGFIAYNNQQGFQDGDQLLIAFADGIKSVLEKQRVRIASRIDGTNFAFLLLDNHASASDQLLHDLQKNLNHLLADYDENLVCIIAAVRYRFEMNISHLLERLDDNFKAMKTHHRSPIFIQEFDAHGEASEYLHSEERVKKAINDRNFTIYKQAIRGEKAILHYELFIKLSAPGMELAAALFLPIARKLGYDYKIDEYMIKTMVNQAEDQPVICINLGESLVYDESKQASFFKILETHQKRHTSIQFEMSELLFSSNRELSQAFVLKLNQLGFKLGLDHVGASLTSFDYLRNSNIAYIKLDSTLCENLHENDYKREMIKNLLRLCDNRHVSLIATNIETKEQWSSLKELGVLWFQGNYIEKPSPLTIQ